MQVPECFCKCRYEHNCNTGCGIQYAVSLVVCGKAFYCVPYKDCQCKQVSGNKNRLYKEHECGVAFHVGTGKNQVGNVHRKEKAHKRCNRCRFVGPGVLAEQKEQCTHDNCRKYGVPECNEYKGCKKRICPPVGVGNEKSADDTDCN